MKTYITVYKKPPNLHTVNFKSNCNDVFEIVLNNFMFNFMIYLINNFKDNVFLGNLFNIIYYFTCSIIIPSLSFIK